jgi:hypothetical protein
LTAFSELPAIVKDLTERWMEMTGKQRGVEMKKRNNFGWQVNS